MYHLHERLVNLRTEYNLRFRSSMTPSQAPVTLQQNIVKGRPELDEVTLRYIQDLLAWVEENQRRVDSAGWGADLPSVESQLGSHRGLHQTVEDFRSKIERARADEVWERVRPAGEPLGCCGRKEVLLFSAAVQGLFLINDLNGCANIHMAWISRFI